MHLPFDSDYRMNGDRQYGRGDIAARLKLVTPQIKAISKSIPPKNNCNLCRTYMEVLNNQ